MRGHSSPPECLAARQGEYRIRYLFCQVLFCSFEAFQNGNDLAQVWLGARFIEETGRSYGVAESGAANKPAHITRGHVMDVPDLSPGNATALKFKVGLYRATLKYARKYSQRDLQVILGEPQPRISEALNGKIANKSVDNFFTMRAC